ncbi:TonB-dependent receptor plug domain-containing protein [Gemmatimonas groenlandica]|uniref:TonB-dependent receptor n=1 Tax=Gemmatimonas groenlandica TaxID=2732249 RepID=A0A6M4ILZ9_9BACT|nr:TonB-dependent receptor [Gemmatimonas groenlandica]QJR35690.1 TonB-dependent receptor [Gemmatimonas groenlandica]
MTFRMALTLWLLATGSPLAAQSPLPSRAVIPSTPSAFVALDSGSTARGALITPVTVNVQDRPLAQVLDDITRQARVSYVADRALPGLDRRVTLAVTQLSAREALLHVVAGSPLQILVGPTGQLVLARRTKPSTAPDTPARRETLRLSGFIRSVSSNEVIRHAVLLVDDEATRRESNEEGFYVLLLEGGLHRVRVRAIGFAPMDTTINLISATTTDLVLRPRTVVLSAMRVQATKAERGDLDSRLPDMSVTRLDLAIAKRIPPLLGEVDPLRTLTLLPGVATTSDASTAFSVRGGSVDQNLILLDESTIYNPSHILGFLSTFNADAVDDVTLYKGAIPAKYGGRLSSVVDVRQREGNAREFAGNASIGLLASRAIVEGPLPFHRGSYMVAGRRSYADAFLRLANDSTIKDNAAYFYDVNAKVNIRIGMTGSVMLSTYTGRDKFTQPSESFAVGWGNRSTTLRWNQAFGRLFSKIASTRSDYDYRLEFRLAPSDSARWIAGIHSSNLKIDETLRLTDHQTLEFGGEIIDHVFRPGDVTPRGDTTLIRRRTIEPRYALASALYLGHEIEHGTRIGIRYGVRYAAFSRNGPMTRYRYTNNAPVTYNGALGRYEPGTLLDSVRITGSRSQFRYDGFEPRASIRFTLTEGSSLKASYARTQQFLQLVSNTNSPTPLDVWEPAGEFIQPQQGNQYALGYSSRRGAYEFTAETYYKTAAHVVDYIDGADVVLNPRLETLLVQGEGRAYGLELFLRRSSGRVSGWASYTLARAEQRFPVPPRAGATSGGGVNGGEWYVSPFDKTHNLSLVGVYAWRPKWTVGSTFIFATGLPTTLPQSRYVIDGFLIAEYGSRNGERLPNYHRLDVSLTRSLRRGELQFGLLNVYNRFNAQSLRVRQQEKNAMVAEAVQTSIFGIVPSINYVFKF